MKKYHSVLTIAGSDCSGGAGIQADIKTISALGCYAASAITAVTVQNTCGVTGIHPIPASYVKAQIDAVMTDIKPKAIKSVVFDPVMVSTSGCKLIEDMAVEAIKKKLIPLSKIITPNLSEAMVLTGEDISDTRSMIVAGKKILELGCHAVLIKGGHLSGNDMYDVLCINDDKTPYIYTASKIQSKNTHGTGCTLSSAIAAFLSMGETLPNAVSKAKDYVHKGILNGKDINIGNGHGPLNHFYSPVSMHIFTENE